ncbi:hypothetical protein Tco_1294251 [Tanacetum coccineum]
MSEGPGTIPPINYAKLNALYDHFVPQKVLSPEQVYWLPVKEIASQASNSPNPVTPFVRTRPAKSQIYTHLRELNTCVPEFEKIIKRRTQPNSYEHGYVDFKRIQRVFHEQVVPFHVLVKQHVQNLNEQIYKDITEYMRIFDELDTDIAKDVCSIVIASDIVVPPSSTCLCEELRLNCDREHSKVVELEAEILKKQQMLNESEKRCAFIEKNHVNLQVKFQKYKECLQNQRVCDNSNSTASNAIFEINKLKDQLQGKDDTIRNLQTQINITRMLNVGSTVENVNLKRRYEELSKSNAYSRSTFIAKINALTAENAKLKTELSGKKSSGSTASEKPKVLALGMYTNSSKSAGCTVADSSTARLKRATTYVFRWFDLSLLSRSSTVQYSYCMVIDSPCFQNKELTTPEQTATGKEISNPFIVDSLLKTISYKDQKKKDHKSFQDSSKYEHVKSKVQQKAKQRKRSQAIQEI